MWLLVLPLLWSLSLISIIMLTIISIIILPMLRSHLGRCVSSACGAFRIPLGEAYGRFVALLRSCMFIGSTRSGSYSSRARSPKIQAIPPHQEIRPKGCSSMWAVSASNGRASRRRRLSQILFLRVIMCSSCVLLRTALDSLYFARIHGHQWNETTGPHRVENKQTKSPGRKSKGFKKWDQKLGGKSNGAFPRSNKCSFNKAIVAFTVVNTTECAFVQKQQH